MTAVIADGAGTPVDQGAATWLFLGAVLFGMVGVQRLRGRSFLWLPRGAAALSGICLVLAVVLPPVIRPDIGLARPSTSVRLQIMSPRPGQVFRGDPASVPVLLRLVGGRIVPFTSTNLVPNAGHVHLYLDGALVSMSLSLSRELTVSPGSHLLQADFVAVDHGPFNPPVQASVRFEVTAR